MKSLSELRAGDLFRHVRTCDRYRPLYYAAASGDFNPIHVDPEVARSAGLPGTILQGMCTFAWLAEACEAYLGAPGRLTRIAARFSRPVAIGDEVTFEGRCTSVEGGRVMLEVSARNGRGEEVLKGARAEAGEPAVPSPAPPAARASSDPRVGRTYGPYRYEACVEKIRDFALAVAGGVPSRVIGAPADPAPHPWYVDEDAARAAPFGSIVAPPTFAAVSAMVPFFAAIGDPASGVDLLRVLHGEQELRYGVPIRAGDRLTTNGAIASVERKGAMELMAISSRTTNQRGELAVEGTWTAIVR
jgi:acyl dehydratase